MNVSTLSSAKACRNQKEIESKLNDALYRNVYTLALMFPTAATNDFRAVLKKDMFVRSNKAAFINVTYFLLEVLDPTLVKQKITMWPVFDSRAEAKFRLEVLKYVNEINTLPQFADLNIQLPNILMSHLISAGGFRFLKFMVKLSNLVLAKHIFEDTDLKDDALLPVMPNKNDNLTKAHIDGRQAMTKKILKETDERLRNFDKYVIECKEKAEQLNGKKRELEKSIAEIKDKIKREETVEKMDASLKPLVEGFQEKLNLIGEIIRKLKDINLFLTELSADTNRLEHNKEEFCVPPDVAHILEPNKDLDLLKFFEAFSLFINNNMLDLPHFSDSVINKQIEKITNENDQLKLYHEELQKIQLRFMDLNKY